MIKKISIQDAPYFTWGEKGDGWFLAKNQHAVIIQECMQPHTSEIRHYHKATWQFFYILSGIATIEIDGNYVELIKGEGIEIPVSLPHNIMNKSDNELTYILISVPNLEGDRVNLA